MQQVSKGTTYTNVTPGNQVNFTNLNNLVDAATLTNGAVIDQNDVSTRAGNIIPLAADRILLGDSTNPDTGVPLSVQLQFLLLQSQRDGTQRWGGVAGGTANALTLATTPASTGAYVTGETVRFKTGVAANTGAVTVNLDARGVVNLYNTAVAALVSGDLPASSVVQAIYDGTEFQVVSVVIPKKTITSYQAAETLRADCQQYAHAGGTANAITIAPLDSSGAAAFTALYDGMTVKFLTTATNTGAATLAVNALGTPALVSATGFPLLAGQLISNQIVEAVYDLPNTVWRIISQLSVTWAYISAATNAAAAGGVVQFAHGLGVVPTKVRAVLVLASNGPVNGYAVNDQIPLEYLQDQNSNVAFSVVADATNITVIRSFQGAVNAFPKGGGGTLVAMATQVNTPNFYWKLIVYASL